MGWCESTRTPDRLALMTVEPTTAALPKPSALVRLYFLAWVFTGAGVVTMITGIVQSQNEPNMFLATAVDVIAHAASVTATFTLAGGFLGTALFGWMIILAVNAILQRMSKQVVE
jgi:hypothetical protein